MLVVRESQALAVGRPTRGVEKATLEMSQDFLSTAFGGTDGQLLLPGYIRGVSDHLAVRRPGGVVFIRVGGQCQVACITVLSRQGKNITTSREDSATAVRGDVEVVVLARIRFTDRVFRIDPL